MPQPFPAGGCARSWPRPASRLRLAPGQPAAPCHQHSPLRCSKANFQVPGGSSRDVGHGLHAARHHNLVSAQHDGLRPQHDRLQACSPPGQQEQGRRAVGDGHGRCGAASTLWSWPRACHLARRHPAEAAGSNTGPSPACASSPKPWGAIPRRCRGAAAPDHHWAATHLSCTLC